MQASGAFELTIKNKGHPPSSLAGLGRSDQSRPLFFQPVNHDARGLTLMNGSTMMGARPANQLIYFTCDSQLDWANHFSSRSFRYPEFSWMSRKLPNQLSRCGSPLGTAMPTGS